MNSWSKKQRLEAVLAGELADRAPVSAWRHFIDREQDAQALAEAMIQFQTENDWDFVKINPRATYYAEAWGNKYRFDEYDGVVPALAQCVISSVKDLGKIQELSTQTGPLLEQLQAIELIRKGIEHDTPIVQTLFSPLAILEYLCGHRTLASNRPAVRSSPVPRLIAENREGVHLALQQITRTIAAYAQAAQRAGANGFFYALLGLVRDGYGTAEEYEEFGRPYDLLLLDAISDSPVILHTCGPEANPEWFADYPIQALHWADLAPGNATLQQSAQWLNRKAAMGGVDEALFATDKTEEIRSQVMAALTTMKERPFILAPGCGLPLQTTKTALQEFRRTVED